MGKKLLKGDEKRGEMHIISPIDLKFTELQKKGWTFFACDVHPLFIINFFGGLHLNHEGGGGKDMN